jgi:hypothetical protein
MDPSTWSLMCRGVRCAVDGGADRDADGDKDKQQGLLDCRDGVSTAGTEGCSEASADDTCAEGCADDYNYEYTEADATAVGAKFAVAGVYVYAPDYERAAKGGSDNCAGTVGACTGIATGHVHV